jgi:hypothetical protein
MRSVPHHPHCLWSPSVAFRSAKVPPANYRTQYSFLDARRCKSDGRLVLSGGGTSTRSDTRRKNLLLDTHSGRKFAGGLRGRSPKDGVPEDVRRLCMSRIKLFVAPAAVLSLVALAGLTVAGGGGQPPGGQIPGNPVPSGQQPGQVPQGFVPGQPPQGVTIPGQSPQGVQSAQSAMHGQGMHMHYMECARVCDDCARICNLCSTHCARLTATGQQQHLQTLATCQDCATVCKAASECSARMGPFASQICMACADICRRCAEACDRSGDDQMMRQCAQECRRCEQACRIMVSRTGGPHAQ